MIFRICGLEPNSSVDGEGLRFAVFFQGCLKKCKGCHNPESWQLFGGMRIDTEEIFKLIDKDPLLQGITLSGGEPFLQPVAALELAKGAHKRGLDVWCWSGYTWEEISIWQDNRAELLREIDVLVDGPFVEEEKSLELCWRGSRNQRVIDVKKSLEKGEVVPYESA